MGGLWGVFGGLWEVFWGLLGALGAILAHLGPKSQHNTKNHRFWTPPPPSWSHLGAQVGPMLGHVWQKSVSKHSWKTCCFKTSFFNENWSPRAPPRTPKIKQNHWRVFKIQGFRLFNISGSWEGSWVPFWEVFWAQVGAKLGQVGPMLEHKPNKKPQQKNIRKMVPIKSPKNPRKSAGKVGGPLQ